jgi:L-aminopeptidase/D-esterase-like protein
MILGVRLGHWTAAEAATGCTVVLLPEGTTASGEVRGGAPATREFALLEPTRLVDRLDAVVLTGGSAFGLACADGVMGWLEEQGAGFPAPAGAVPIVVGLGLYDLAVGDAAVRPGPAAGRAACLAARETWTGGPVGAGSGARVGKWRGEPRPGGLGVASAVHGDLTVAAVMAVNAYGEPGGEAFGFPGRPPAIGANTTIGVVVTDARLTKAQCLVVAQGGHDGMARALWPPHCTVDGDAVVAAATGRVEAPLDLVRALAVRAVEDAVRAAVPAVGPA